MVEPPALVYDEKEEIQIHPSQSEATTFVTTDLTDERKAKLVACLRQNHDVFTWSTHELLGISPSVAQHELHIPLDARLVKQRKRDFSQKHNQITRAEIKKLLEVVHIRKVQFLSWLTNVVLVSKPGNKWRVYIDFRYLNMACQQDFYPMPCIDQMVDSTVGCNLICMLDAYQGYHQVSLTKEDQENVIFITADGTYCYNVMSF